MNQTHQQVSERIEAAFQKAESVYGQKFARCKVRCDIMANARKAGSAQVHPERLIRINPRLFRQNPSHILDITCPHEVAHIVAFDLYGSEGWGHGPKWKSVMRSIGLAPDRCHSLVTPSSLSKPVYECQKCKKQAIVPPKTHFRIKNKLATLRNCRCGGNYTHLGRVSELVKNKSLTCRELPENQK